MESRKKGDYTIQIYEYKVSKWVSSLSYIGLRGGGGAGTTH